MSQHRLARKIRILEIFRVRVGVCALSGKLEFDTNVNFELKIFNLPPK